MTRSTYRTVSKSSNVDESLFGYSKNGSKLRATSSQGFEKISEKKREPALASSSSGSRRSTGARSASPAAPSHVAVLTAAELARMRAPASVLDHDEIQAIRVSRRESKESERARGHARREKMLALEATRAANKAASESEQVRAEQEAATRTRAEILMDEQKDEVKNMNQMMLYSKCVTIRDAQLEEKKHIMAEAQEEERRMDLMMEIERMKALDLYEERERQRQEDRKKGAAVLMKQIEERARERTRQEELLDLDRRQMLAEMQRMKDEEAAEAARKREAGRKLLDEVARANAAQLDRKKLVIQAEREEEERIARYVADRDAREMREQMERERVAREKEMETARMRAQQEKQADTQAEMDELRAMRIQEEHERAFRAKELAAVERQRAINEDLRVARERQQMLKLKQLGDQAREEQEEFYRVIDAQMQREQEDAAAAAHAAAMRRNHKEELQAQIAFNDEKRERERREYLEEGDRLRAALAEERAKLEAIKQRKLDELAGSGIPTKYRAELAKKRIAT